MDDPCCECQRIDSGISDEIPEESTSVVQKHVAVKFGSVIVDTTAYQKVDIKNSNQHTTKYIIKRDPDTNPIYHVFDFNKYEAQVESGDTWEITVTYKPVIPNEKNVDNFTIVSEDQIYEVCTQGESIGPIVNSSTRTLYFFFNASNHKQTIKQTFEVQNSSDMSTYIQFDVNRTEQTYFRVDKFSEVLGPRKHTYVNVTCNLPLPGYYNQKLVCLVMHHAPIIIELIGVYTLHSDFDLAQVNLMQYQFLMEEIQGYGGYLFDTAKILTRQPPFTLNETWLDFGRVENGKDNEKTLVACLTNHMKRDISVMWEEDNIFEIVPHDVTIPPKESVLYECHFRPNAPDTFFSRILHARVYWCDTRSVIPNVETITIPLTSSLRFLGHSFPVNKGWLPRVEIIPNVIILPPAVPNHPCYRTFMLKSFGHLPVAFKFLPPKKTNFTLKPMIGLIEDFQIVVVELFPDKEKTYMERWDLELNNRNESCLPFFVKGYCEYPTLVVGQHNTVRFGTIHPNCQEFLTVPIANPTSHHLWYKFDNQLHDYVHIDHPEGELVGNERTMLKWTCTGGVKAPEKSTIKCEIRYLQKSKSVVGHPLTVKVNVFAKCSYSKLCATPTSLDFGEIQWSTTKTLTFHLFNFGESPIYLQLFCKDTTPLSKNYIMVSPQMGTIKPKKKMEVVVQFTAQEIGNCNINIVYKIRLNEYSYKFVLPEEKFEVFSFQFMCMYPTLQIQELVNSNFNHLFSKITLWELLKIDEFNRKLKEIVFNETKTIRVCLPDYECSDKIITTTLVIKNITNFPTYMKFVKKKICDCKILIKPKGLSLRERVYDCIHREMTKIETSSEIVEALGREKVILKIKYLEPGPNRLLYILNLCDNRRIKLYITINSLPEPICMPSKYSHDLKFDLKSVYVGEKEPSLQAFWLYNNSKNSVTYHVNAPASHELCQRTIYDAISCVNPKGTLLPYTSHAVLFKFTPLEMKRYQVSLMFILGNVQNYLEVSGEGSDVYNSHLDEMSSLMSPTPKNLFNENSVTLSVDHIILDSFSVWTETEKMLFIQNVTKDRIVGYCWETFIIENTIEAQVVCPKGVLQPNESHAIVLKIKSFSNPCLVRFQLPCKLLDHTQQFLHKKSLAEYNLMEEELRGQFTITEKGTFYPDNTVKIEPQPEQFYLSLAISLHTVSISDRDLCLTAEEQWQQCPQSEMKLNTSQILQNYWNSMKHVESPIKSFYIDMIKQKEEAASTASSEEMPINYEKEDVEILSNLLERIFADAVFNRQFDDALEKIKTAPVPYYHQFKMDIQPTDECTPKENVTNTTLVTRAKLVEEHLKRPQSHIMAAILKELLNDSLHEIFRLGPQIKNRPPTPKQKSNFTCG